MVTIKPSQYLNHQDFFLRKLFDNSNILFEIIVYYPQCDKIKLLVSLYKYMPNDDSEEVVSTDIISV